MKVLITGANGQLGHDIIRICKQKDIEFIGVDVEEMDITNQDKVKQVICSSHVDAVIHCAAYTAVDAAEDNVDLCTKVNVEGTRNIARVCQELNIKMMYFSTDYVFDGLGENYWGEYDERRPLNVYGDTKCDGEKIVETMVKEHFIIRISWVFGIHGKNFVKTMLQLGEKNGSVRVVNDQIGSPTYTYDLAGLVVDMIQTNKYGKYHVTNEGICSWYDFACEIFKQAGMEVEVTPVDSDAFPVKAKRPLNSRLSKEELDKNGFSHLPSWQDALRRYLEALK